MLIPWLTTKSLSAGDWPYLFPENIAEFSFPPKWPFLWLTPFYQLTAKIFVQYLGLSWELTEKIVWFWPFLVLTTFSSWYLTKVLFGSKNYLLFTIYYLLFGFNTYILMVVGGGQMGVAMAYALVPLVLGRFIQSIQTSNFKHQTITGLVFGVQIMFDPRIALLTLGAVVLYWVIKPFSLRSLFFIIIIPGLVACVLNFYWILPMIIFGNPALTANYSQTGWVNYLSVAKFSNTLSLLHPNWPENIFGKVSFFKPEFLGLPLLAFSSLLFISKRHKILVSYFALLGLIGAFLAKGINPPAGFIFRWLFENFPGFDLFRDPTKFYVLVAISYSVLVPFSIYKIYSLLKSKVKYLFLLFTIFYLLFLIRPLIFGQLGGTFKARQVPQEYIALKDFLVKDRSFGKVLWLPTKQRFGFSSNLHPAVEASQWIADEKCLEPFCSLRISKFNRDYFNCHPNEKCYPADASFLANPRVVDVLSELSVKYIIIPYDSEGEIFLYERKYDPEHRQKLEEFLDTIPWLKKIDLVGKIAVYEVLDLK